MYRYQREKERSENTCQQVDPVKKEKSFIPEKKNEYQRKSRYPGYRF
jgi:hypothetical protein